MKIISLNIWGGRIYEPLKVFIKTHSSTVDVFCFQEVRNGEIENEEEGVGEIENLFKDISEILPDFIGYFAEQVYGVGSAVFVKNTLKVRSENSFQILSAKDLAHVKRPNGNSYYPRIMQVVSLTNPDITIYNFHGIPGTKKKDTPERDLQTERLLEILEKDDSPKILVGDFNLDMETRAIGILEKIMKNLVREYGFIATRNHNYSSYKELPFSDYAFISKEIQVKDFKVLSDEVSDHNPLYLEFEI